MLLPTASAIELHGGVTAQSFGEAEINGAVNDVPANVIQEANALYEAGSASVLASGSSINPAADYVLKDFYLDGTVNYLVKDGNLPPGITYEQFKNSIGVATSAWNVAGQTWLLQPRSFFGAVQNAPTNALNVKTDGQSIISFMDGTPLVSGGNWVACNYLSYQLGGPLYESDVVFNNRYRWTLDGKADKTAFDLTAVALHEIGHSTGLDNTVSNSRANLMGSYVYGDPQYWPGPGDLAGLAAKYGGSKIAPSPISQISGAIIASSSGMQSYATGNSASIDMSAWVESSKGDRTALLVQGRNLQGFSYIDDYYPMKGYVTATDAVWAQHWASFTYADFFLATATANNAKGDLAKSDITITQGALKNYHGSAYAGSSDFQKIDQGAWAAQSFDAATGKVSLNIWALNAKNDRVGIHTESAQGITNYAATSQATRQWGNVRDDGYAYLYAAGTIAHASGNFTQQSCAIDASNTVYFGKTSAWSQGQAAAV